MCGAKRKVLSMGFWGGLAVAVSLVAVAALVIGQTNAGQQTADDSTSDSGLTTDFQQMSWVDAFNALHERMSKEYAFTDWKGIDWDELYEKYSPAIIDADTKGDFSSYYATLRSYLNEIPDGHVIATDVSDVSHLFTGGGFGFSLTRTTDRGICVTWVDPEGPAFAAGIRVGMSLSSWDGLPVEDALAATSTIFTKNSATDEDLDWARVAYLSRAEVGALRAARFETDDGTSLSVELTAYDDAGASLKKAYPFILLSDKVRSLYMGVDDPSPVPTGMVEHSTLDNGVIYIKVWGELDVDLQGTGTAPSTLDLFRSAVQEAIDSQAPGIVVDLRNNMGGSDLMAAAMLGSFYTSKTFYEYANAYDPSTGVRQIESVDGSSGDSALYIEPADQVYTGPVVALVNMKCVSSGEGLAMGISKLAKGEVVGFSGTNGSFGLCGPTALMPNGVVVEWPSGQSLDENGIIQLDSKDGVGGVAPSIRVPMTLDNALSVAGGDDVELKWALQAIAAT